MKVRVAGIIQETVVDGPGVRLALYAQGCPFRCKGCHNPATHDPLGGFEMATEQITGQIAAARYIDGVTFSGGEPFLQAAPLALLGEEVRRRGLNLLIFSGYTFEKLYRISLNDRDTRRLLAAGHILIDGPYHEEERELTLPFRGSSNQRMLDLIGSMKYGRAVEWQAGAGRKIT